MTTQSWSTRIRHDTDATFREWGLEFNTKLAAAGLVQTADTGQINWATVTLPTAGNDGGYEIWKLNDSLFATAPVYFKIVYGTNSGGANIPRLRFQVGTATDGAGTLSGTASSTLRDTNTQANQTTDTARQSYLCVTEGFFGFAWKTGAASTEAAFFFCRTVNGAGAITVTGGIAIWGVSSTNQLNATQAYRFAAPAAAYTARLSPSSQMLGFSPQAPISTQVGADIQAMVGWTLTPQVVPLVGVCGVLHDEVSAGSTFTTTLVGTSARTYIGLTPEVGPFGPGSPVAASGQPKFAMLWE